MPDDSAVPGTDQSLRPVLIRGLRRSFSIGAEWSHTPLAALAIEYDIEGPAPEPEPIAIEHHGRFFRLRTPAGQVVDGTLADLAMRIDRAVAEQFFRIEVSDRLLLPAAILRAPDGARCAFVGARATGKTWLCLSLLEAGWRFEGDGWAVVHDRGVTSLPRTLRIVGIPPHLSPALRAGIEASPKLSFGVRGQEFVLDPRSFGDWRLETGDVTRAFFLELNPGGCSSVMTLRPEAALARALAMCRGRPAGKSLIGLHRAVCNGAACRIRLGSPAHVAEALARAMSSSSPQDV